jgi:hypothetical protein
MLKPLVSGYILVTIHALNFEHQLFDHFVLILSIIGLFEVGIEEKCYCLVETGCQTSLVFFDDFVAIVAGFPVDEFHQYFALVNRKIGQGLGKFLFKFFFSGVDILFPLFFF